MSKAPHYWPFVQRDRLFQWWILLTDRPIAWAQNKKYQKLSIIHISCSETAFLVDFERMLNKRSNNRLFETPWRHCYAPDTNLSSDKCYRLGLCNKVTSPYWSTKVLLYHHLRIPWKPFDQRGWQMPWGSQANPVWQGAPWRQMPLCQGSGLPTTVKKYFITYTKIYE